MKKFYSFLFVSCMLLFVANTASAQLLSHLQLNETSGFTASDLTSNNNFGDANCDTCWVEDGYLGGAMKFFGTENIFLDGATMGLTADAGSVAMWIFVDNTPSGIYTVFSGGDNGTGGGFGPENEMHFHIEGGPNAAWNGGELSWFTVADPGTFLHSDPTKGNAPGDPPLDPIVMGDSIWHHVVATWGNGTVSMYIDGAVVPGWDTTVYNSTGYALDTVRIGSMLSGGRAMVGRIDEVRIYAHPVDEFEVAEIYEWTNIKNQATKEVKMSVYPNPVSDNATIRFSLEGRKNISVNVISVTGGLVANVFNGASSIGLNEINLNTSNYAPGVYFVELNADNKVTHSKFVIR